MTHLKSPRSSRHGTVMRLSGITRTCPDETSAKAKLSDLRYELEEVEQMIRLLEWASTPPTPNRN